MRKSSDTKATGKTDAEGAGGAPFRASNEDNGFRFQGANDHIHIYGLTEVKGYDPANSVYKKFRDTPSLICHGNNYSLTRGVSKDSSFFWFGDPSDFDNIKYVLEHGLVIPGIASNALMLRINHHSSRPTAASLNRIDQSASDRQNASLPKDEDRLAFLARAAQRDTAGRDPLQELESSVRADAITLLGGEAGLGRIIPSEEGLVEALAAGFPADVISRLREAGYSYAVLEQVVAPRRTLMRRKSAQQRLTRSESDAVWRLAHVLALAERVLDGRKAALAWLGRKKGSFNGRTPIDLIETSIGTAYVERILRSLDWGDVA